MMFVMTNQPRILSVLCAAALLTGCGGTSQSGSGLPSGNKPANEAAGRSQGTIAIRIHIPTERAGRQARSWATKGIALAFNAYFGTFAFNLTRINRAQCSGSPLVCTITLTLPVGHYSPTVTVYDQAPVNGTIPTTAAILAFAKSVPLSVTGGAGSKAELILGGDVEHFTVPTGVTGIAITARGASTGNSGSVSATIPVKPGESLTVFAGGVGNTSDDPHGGGGGFNGGGDGFPGRGQNIGGSGGGSGASDVRLDGSALSNRVLVAGGDGGFGGYGPPRFGRNGSGGAGGGSVGGAGTAGRRTDTEKEPGRGGGGGTQTAGGVGGTGGATTARAPGEAGALGIGGSGGRSSGGPGGGGGGGYYGGGGGGAAAGFVFQDQPVSTGAGGGGGGSSFVEPGATNVIDARGGEQGDGIVLILW
jgi:hypothetical protein